MLKSSSVEDSSLDASSFDSEDDKADLLFSSQRRVTPLACKAVATAGRTVVKTSSCTRRVSIALHAAG